MRSKERTRARDVLKRAERFRIKGDLDRFFPKTSQMGQDPTPPWDRPDKFTGRTPGPRSKRPGCPEPPVPSSTS